MFGRKKRSSVEARTRLLNTDFPCSSPGVELVRVDYDPAVWTRCPTRGEDRTTWAEQTLAAYVEDLGLSAEDPLRLRLAEALGRIADDPLSHTCTFVHLPTTGSGKDGQILVWVDVADEEVTLLEHGTPETFLAFTDLDPGHPEQPQVFQNGWSASAKMGLDEDGQSQWTSATTGSSSRARPGPCTSPPAGSPAAVPTGCRWASCCGPCASSPDLTVPARPVHSARHSGHTGHAGRAGDPAHEGEPHE
ncbi:MAG: hypothetical protein ACXVWU_06930 [Nocardioides sp.]